MKLEETKLPDLLKRYKKDANGGEKKPLDSDEFGKIVPHLLEFLRARPSQKDHFDEHFCHEDFFFEDSCCSDNATS